MKLTILQSSLSKALSIINRNTGSKSTLPILSTVLLKAYKNNLELIATNLEQAINIKLGAKVDIEGQICISAKLLQEIVANINEDKIEIILDNNQIEIRTDNYHSKINIFNSNEYPEIPTTTVNSKININDIVLSNLISPVTVSCQQDSNIPVLTGILFDFNNNKLTIASTDSFRLSQNSLELAHNLNTKFIIPISSINELIKIIGSDDFGDIVIMVGENQIEFVIGHIKYTSRLIEGNFPDYTKILPTEHKGEMNLKKDDLFRTIKLVDLVAKENSHLINAKVADNKLLLSASANDIGENDAYIEIDHNGDDVEFIINGKFLLEALSVCDSSDVLIQYINNSSPIVLKDKVKPNYLHLIMPLKV